MRPRRHVLPRRPAEDWRGIRRSPDRRPAAAGRPSGRVPKRSCRAIQPSTQPGTVTVRMSWRNGISTWPSARSAAASAPEPARPVEFNANTSPSRCTSANRSPPKSAQMRRGDGDGCVRCDGCVDRVAAEHQCAQPGLRCKLIGAGNEALRGADRVETRRGHDRNIRSRGAAECDRAGDGDRRRSGGTRWVPSCRGCGPVPGAATATTSSRWSSGSGSRSPASSAGVFVCGPLRRSCSSPPRRCSGSRGSGSPDLPRPSLSPTSEESRSQ